MVLLGGVQTLSGPIVGALAFTGCRTSWCAPTDWRLVLGGVIVALVLCFPAGHGRVAQRAGVGEASAMSAA